jgi:hypothetical protein
LIWRRVRIIACADSEEAFERISGEAFSFSGEWGTESLDDFPKMSERAMDLKALWRMSLNEWMTWGLFDEEGCGWVCVHHDAPVLGSRGVVYGDFCERLS